MATTAHYHTKTLKHNIFVLLINLLLIRSVRPLASNPTLDDMEAKHDCDNTITKTADRGTLVVLGANPMNVNALVALLSDDGHLEVKVTEDGFEIVNPDNKNWLPDPKYKICADTSETGIDGFVSGLKKPYEFVVVGDAGDMFGDGFWVMMNHLAKAYVKGSNLVKVVEMNILADGIPLQQRLDEFRSEIQNGLRTKLPAGFTMVGMHLIEESGAVRNMPQLKEEVAAIKLVVDQ